MNLQIFILFVLIDYSFQSPTGSPKERVVTNFKDVYNGVEIDFSYNETSSTNDTHTSAPGCPKSEVGVLPWVYFDPSGSLPAPKNCYLAGQHFPCEVFNDHLARESGTNNGICVTTCFLNDGIVFDTSKMQFCEKDIRTYPTREFVFHPDMKKSFAIYEQGPCKENEWLVKIDGEDKTSPKVICEPRKCPQDRIPTSAVKNQGNTDQLLSELPFGIPEASNCTYAQLSPPPDSFGATIQTSSPSTKCEENEKYSDLLNKCIRNHPKPKAVIG